MKEIRRALYSKLTADATLQTLVGARVYDGLAPQSAAYPLIVFQLQAATDAYTFTQRTFEDHLWLVKAIDRSQSADVADDIVARVDDVLTDGALAITGRTQLYLRRAGAVRFTEQDGDVIYRHVGGTFRLWTRET